MEDEYFMKEALKEARISLENGDWPIGCVIVFDGEIISRAHNKVYSEKDKLAHAEMLAIEKVKDKLNDNRKRAVLYSTYEPYPMCFGTVILSRIKRVVCGIDLDKSGAMYFKDNLPILFKQERWDVELSKGILADECYDVFIKGEPVKKMIRDGVVRVSDKKIEG